MKIQALSTDRISALPVPIIHRILTLLPTESIKEANSLSKTWYGFCSSFPYFDFDDHSLDRLYGYDDIIEYVTDEEDFHPDFKPESERFLNYIGETLTKFHKRNPRFLVKRIRINLTLVSSSLMSLLSDRIRLALEHGVEKIDLVSRGFCYNLPAVLFSSNWIRVLKIEGGTLLDSFRHGDISVSYSKLRKLVITGVYIDELAMGSIISNCPLIEKLAFKNIMGLTNLRISCLYKLKSLVVTNTVYTCKINTVEVDAPMLHSIELTEFDCPCKIGMLECPRLTKLNLSHVDVGNFQLEEILSRLPLLRSLRLSDVFSLTKLKISNNSLEHLAATRCEHLVELDINAPNLLWFRFCSNSVPLMAPMHTIKGESYISLDISWEPSFFENFAVKFRNFLSRLEHVHRLSIYFKERPVPDIDGLFEFDSNLAAPLMGPMHTITGTSYVTLDIARKPSLYDNHLAVKFRNFLSRMGRVNNLDIHLKHFGVINVDEHFEAVTDVDELKITVVISEGFQDNFNGLLRSYHPRILIMQLNLYKNADFTTFLRDIAVGVGNCCSWFPHLEEITIVADNVNVFQLLMDGSVPPIALENYHWSWIKFVFKWRSCLNILEMLVNDKLVLQRMLQEYNILPPSHLKLHHIGDGTKIKKGEASNGTEGVLVM